MQAIHTNLYASSWFLTLFTTSLPLPISCRFISYVTVIVRMMIPITFLFRIMDCFLSEGIETIFRISLTLLMIAKHELLLLDMEGVIKYFQVNDSPKTFDYLWICLY